MGRHTTNCFVSVRGTAGLPYVVIDGVRQGVSSVKEVCVCVCVCVCVTQLLKPLFPFSLCLCLFFVSLVPMGMLSECACV